MILVTSGDSWTQGDSPAQEINWEAKPTEKWYNIPPNFGDMIDGEPTRGGDCDNRIKYKFYDSDVWPKVLGRKLGWETWNAGRLGSSNDKILRTTIATIEYLESIGKRNFFVVVGLTSPFRYETWNEYKPGAYHQDRVDSREWLEFGDKKLTHKTCLDIIHLQNFLKCKNIPYLIFSAFDNFDDDIKKDKLYKYIDLENIYNRNFDGHFYNYIREKYNIEDWKTEPYFRTLHPTDISHIEWGEELYKYIRSNYEFF